MRADSWRTTSIRACARRNAFFLGVFLCSVLEHRIYDLFVGLIPGGNHFEFVAVLLHDACPVITHVVAA
jgi:hypothetical protein